MSPILAQLPHSPEAERALIGSCLISREAVDSTLLNLKASDFTDTNCRVIFDCIRELSILGKPIDYITVADSLKSKEYLDRIGGTQFLIELADAVPTTANLKTYTEIIKEYSTRRKLIEASESVIRIASNNDESLPVVIATAEKLIFNASQDRSSSDEFQHIGHILSSVFTNISDNRKSGNIETIGWPTGLIDLDQLIGGLQPGSLNIIAARPSMGKTALALNIAQFGGNRSNNPVLIFSLEMPAEHLAMRMLAAECTIPLSGLMRGTISTEEFQSVKRGCNELSHRNIYINDATSLSAMEFRAKCRQFKMRHPDTALNDFRR